VPLPTCGTIKGGWGNTTAPRIAMIRPPLLLCEPIISQSIGVVERVFTLTKWVPNPILN
jgi:hypothetical protein